MLSVAALPLNPCAGASVSDLPKVVIQPGANLSRVYYPWPDGLAEQASLDIVRRRARLVPPRVSVLHVGRRALHARGPAHALPTPLPLRVLWRYVGRLFAIGIVRR